MKKITFALLMVILLTGCGSATPAPVVGTLDTEFTLAPNQTATLTNRERAAISRKIVQ